MNMKDGWGETLVAESALFKTRWTKEIYRARPEGGWYPPEISVVPNLIVNNGMDYLADRIGSRTTGSNSTMSVVCVGTVTTAATLTNASITGEVKRKLFDSTSRNGNIWIYVNTFGGAADTITSVQIAEAGTLNSATSGTGVLFQRVVFATVVLADSDFLKLQVETTVGSR